MAAPYPKPDNERARRNAPTFDWVNLPTDGRKAPAPPMPFGKWHPETVKWWERHWSHPCASQWLETDPVHERLCWLQDDLYVRQVPPSGTQLAEMRSIEDRLGLNPKARLVLRWRLAPDASTPNENRSLATVKPINPSRPDPRVS